MGVSVDSPVDLTGGSGEEGRSTPSSLDMMHEANHVSEPVFDPSVAAVFYTGGDDVNSQRLFDGGPSTVAGPSRTSRNTHYHTRRPYEVPLPCDGEAVPVIVSRTVAKPSVLSAAIARRKKAGKYPCILCPATFTERHGVQSM